MGTTRSYACATQAGLTQRGSNVMRTSRGVLPVRPRRATLASLYLWRGAFIGQHALERCPQKPITIPRSQLCSWNARRELYQHVGNFVGSVISPVLANVYLHYALDLWFEQVVKPHCQGEALLCRYADDWVCAFRLQEDAERFFRVLPKRLGKFPLQVAPEKTHLRRLGRFHPSKKRRFTFWDLSSSGCQIGTACHASCDAPHGRSSTPPANGSRNG